MVGPQSNLTSAAALRSCVSNTRSFVQFSLISQVGKSIMALVLAVGFGIPSANAQSPVKSSSKNKQSEGNEFAAGSRLQWELKRLADPATGKIPDHMRAREIAYVNTLPKSNQVISPLAQGLSTGWNHRGPYFIGGRTRAIGIDRANPNRILAGSVSGGIWLSTNNGASWQPVQEKDQLRSATCLAQDIRTGKQHIWFCGSGEAYGQSASAKGAYYLGDGLFVSYDSGQTWQPITSTAMGANYTFSTQWQLVWNLAIDASAPDQKLEIYCANYQNVMRSDDSGKTWKTFLSGLGYHTDVALTSNGVVYATSSADGGKKGIFRAANDGSPVNITPAALVGKNFNRIVIGIDPNNENRVYFLMNNDDFGKRTTNYKGDPEYNSFWRYTYLTGNGALDSGIWEDLTANLPAQGTSFEKWNVQGSYDMLVRVQPGDSQTVYIGGTNLYRSTSAFSDSTHTRMIGGYRKGSVIKDWDAWPTHHPDQHNLLFYPNNSKQFLSTNDGGVFRCNDASADSIVWQSLNNGYLVTQFYAVAMDHGTPGSALLVGGAQDNNQLLTVTEGYKSIWKTVYPGDGAFCAVADGAKSFYFSKQQGKMIKAEIDGDGNRTKYRRIDPVGGEKYLFINPFTLDPNNNNIMYLAGGKYVWRNNLLDQVVLDNSIDSMSLGWTRFPDSIPIRNEWVSAVAVSKKPANRLYYGASVKRVYRMDSAHLGAKKPVDITAAALPSAYVSCIAIDPRNADRILVSYSNYAVYSIWLSEDAGKTYSKVAGNLEQYATGLGDGPSVRWVSILPVKDGVVYLAATSAGFYATDTLQGLNTVWVQQATGEIGNMVCDMFDVRESDGTVALATHGNGILSAKIAEKSAILGVKTWEKQKLGTWMVSPNPAKVGEVITGTFTYNGALNLNSGAASTNATSNAAANTAAATSAATTSSTTATFAFSSAVTATNSAIQTWLIDSRGRRVSEVRELNNSLENNQFQVKMQLPDGLKSGVYYWVAMPQWNGKTYPFSQPIVVNGSK